MNAISNLVVMAEVIKSLWLNILEPTVHKNSLLNDLELRYSTAVNSFEDAIEFWDGYADIPMTKFNLQKIWYQTIKSNCNLQAQIVVDAVKDAWAKRDDYTARIRHPAIPFNVPRSGSSGLTERGNPVFSVSVNHHRIGLPIKRDGAWDRFNILKSDGYGFTQFKLKRKDNRWFVIVTLKKQVVVKEPSTCSAVIGVDVGNSVLATISLCDVHGGIKRQLYLGQELKGKQRDFCIRRSKLLSHADKGSTKAVRKLRRLRQQESNYATTRCYEVAHNIVGIAEMYDATIVIENLTNLRDSVLSRKSDRSVKRMPYNVFRQALESVAHQNGIEVSAVNPKDTSRTCSRCGTVSKSARKGSTYTCKKCGFVCNADRNASVNIARKLSLERDKTMTTNLVSIQHSSDKGPVNSLAWNDDRRLDSGLQPVRPPLVQAHEFIHG